MIVKECKQCKKEKDVSLFYNSKLGKFGVRGECKKCYALRYYKDEKRLKYSRKWRRDNKDKLRPGVLLYRSKNKNKISETSKKWGELHKKERKIWKREWYLTNIDRIKLYNKKYHADPDNRKMIAERKRKYYRNNTEYRLKKRIYGQNYHKRVKNVSDGSVTYIFIKELFNKQKGRCAITDKSLLDGFHIDHIIPISKGGLHISKNIQLLLPTVNLQKKDRLNCIINDFSI